MKHVFYLVCISIFSLQLQAQSKNYIDQPYIETEVSVDTLVVPDKIHLKIILNEEDSKNKKSTEALERDMYKVLKSLDIDTKKDLTLLDASSDFKSYFLSGQKVLKSKVYAVIVHDAVTTGKVMAGLEHEGISNVSITKTEYSKSEQLFQALRTKAVVQAKTNAENMVAPLQQTVGKAIHISDYNAISGNLYGKVSGIQIRGVASMSDNYESAPIEVDFEKLNFSVRVGVKFLMN